MSHPHHQDDANGARSVADSAGGGLADAENQARYLFALEHAAGKRVLDAGCGAGRGTELLLQAGAESVVGLDASEEVLAEARRRAPGCEFVQGDLQDLPFADGEFDLVVCFREVGYVAEMSATLNQLIRVLSHDGLLFVSSPTPAVAPDVDEPHLPGLTSKLAQSVADRLPHNESFRQHRMVASVITNAQGDSPVDIVDGRTHSITGFGADTNSYSIVVASRRPLPALAQWTCLAPLIEPRRPAEQGSSTPGQPEHSHQQPHGSERTLRELIAERDDARQRAVDLHTQWEATNVQLINQRAAAENAAAERDDVTVRLVHALQTNASPIATGELTSEAAAQISQLQTELVEARAKAKRARNRARNLQTRLAAATGSPSFVDRIRGRRERG